MTPRADIGANPGHLRMLSYVPADLPPKSPLVVVLHGCGQSAEGYAAGAGWLTLAERFGFAVLAPEQTSSNNPNRCFNWFSPDDATRGVGEVASIAAMIALIVRSESLDPARVFVTGLSAGGAMTLAMLAAYPERFAGGAVIAGLPYGIAADMVQAMMAMGRADHRSAAELSRLIPASGGGGYPRLTVWHGQSDRVVAPVNGDLVARQWALAHGLGEEPDETTHQGDRTRSVWRDPAGGVAVIELNRLAGLGHGVPLSTKGPDGIGRTGPFMLEAGVSSSEEILAFWGLERPASARRPASSEPGRAPAPSAPATLGDQVLASLDRVPSPVKDVIAKALKTAGLSG